MAICGTCGQSATKISTVMTSGGKLLPEDQRKDRCPNCDPGYFHDFTVGLYPIDRKLWNDHEANPRHYKLMPNGFMELKDEQKQEIQDVWDQDPDAEAREKAIARKRAQRRTAPLTRTEIEQAEQVWRPIVKQLEEDTKRQEEGDALYTENLIEDMMRKERAKELVQ